MAIQQQLNSLLGMGTVAVGLYAHSPAGKKAREINELGESIKQGEKNYQAAQQGYIRAGWKGEEAQYMANDVLEETIKQKERLAALTNDEKLYEEIGYDKGLREFAKEEYAALKGKERSIAEGQEQVREFMDNKAFMEELRARAEAAGFGKRQTRVFEKQAKRLEGVGK